MGCASAPPEDSAPAPSQGIAPPAAASSASGADANDATLTPAERQARARQAAVQADQDAQQALQQQCSDLRAQIREQQLDEQQAPNTSVSEQIVQAKEAHADQHIQDLQDRYNSLDCPTVAGPPSHTPLVPVSPASNGLSPPGAQGVPSVP
jgi:TolA-binding protein